MRNSNVAAINKEHNAEIKRIRASSKSEKEKAKEIEKLEKAKAKAEEEAAKRQLAFTAITGAANTALAIQAQIMAILNVTRDTPGGPFIKAAAGLAIGAATIGLVAQVKAAQSQIPRREHGGSTRKGNIYQVGENNKSEILEENGKKFLIAGDNGAVSTNTTNNGGSIQIVNNFHGTQNVDEIQEVMPSMIAQGFEQADRQNLLDYGRYPNFQRAIGN
jgi:hypothetical protein